MIDTSRPASPRRLVVLLSGSGTLFEALLGATQDPAYGAQVVAVGADRDGIRGLQVARDHGIPTFVEQTSAYPDRAAWDAALADSIMAFEPDLVVSAGFMKLIGSVCLQRFPDRIINTHPALCPAFPGMHGPADALAYGVKVTGTTLFFVRDGVDDGPVIDQVPVLVAPDDDVSSLHERIKVAEREMLIDNVGRMVRHGWTITGRKVQVHS